MGIKSRPVGIPQYKADLTLRELFRTRRGQENSATQVSEALSLMFGDAKFEARECKGSREDELRLRDLDGREDC